MKLSYESGIMLAANVAVGAAHIYLKPQGGIISLLAGMAIGNWFGSEAVNEVMRKSSFRREESANSLFDAIPRFGTLLLGTSALMATIKRVGTTQILGSEQSAMSLSLIILGYYLGMNLKLFALKDQVEAALKIENDPTVQTRLRGYLDRTV